MNETDEGSWATRMYTTLCVLWSVTVAREVFEVWLSLTMSEGRREDKAVVYKFKLRNATAGKKVEACDRCQTLTASTTDASSGAPRNVDGD